MRSPIRKITDVAAREFRATAMTKAFFFGVFLFPVIIISAVTLLSGLFDSPAKQLKGSISVLDTSSPEQPVAAGLEEAFEPARLQAAYDAKRAEWQKKIDDSSLPPQIKQRATKALKKMAPAPDDVQIVRLPADADLEAEKTGIREGERLAVLAVDQATMAGEKPYQLFIGKNLDVELQENLKDIVADTVVDARLAHAGMPSDEVRKLTARPRDETRTVTDTGDTKSLGEAALFLPMAFMMLLWIAVFSSGQYLLTTTIEEKSSRVMELLLSAVSPMQLMTGKIVGQALVGLAILAVYAGIGMVAAGRFGFLSLVPMDKLVWLGVYFVMAYFLIGSMMAAIGSAVNELREAQSLMSVAMLVLMLPMLLWLPIIRQPNSTFSTVASFIPPMTPFVMILRMAQNSEPIPVWQVVGATAIGFAAVVVAIWAAAKIFRVGVLMYGKPPTPLTLIKWIRYA